MWIATGTLKPLHCHSRYIYVSDLLDKFTPYMDAKCTRNFDSPMEEGVLLSADDCPVMSSSEYDEMAPNRQAYMSIVGGILWLANMTRPDLAYPAAQLARFLSNPGKKHLAAASRLLIYLRGTRDRKLIFRPSDGYGFETYVDSSWTTRFSCSGALYFYHGCLFHWFTKTQRSVTLSSAEAEFFGAMLAAKDIIFIRELLTELSILIEGPSIMYSDSRSAVILAFDPVAFKNTKHILRAAEFLRDLVTRRVVTLEHVAGTTMIADLLTKACARPVFIALMRLLDDFSSSHESHMRQGV